MPPKQRHVDQVYARLESDQARGGPPMRRAGTAFARVGNFGALRRARRRHMRLSTAAAAPRG